MALGTCGDLWMPLTCPVSQGYEGLVEGGDNIKPATWLSVSNIIQLVRVAPACALAWSMCLPLPSLASPCPFSRILL